MSRLYRLQPSPRTDHITADGHELTQLPYPYFATEDGTLTSIHTEMGSEGIIGFQDDLAVQHVDLWWDEVIEDPQCAVGKYVVTREHDGGMATHQIAIASVEVLEGRA